MWERLLLLLLVKQIFTALVSGAYETFSGQLSSIKREKTEKRDGLVLCSCAIYPSALSEIYLP